MAEEATGINLCDGGAAAGTGSAVVRRIVLSAAGLRGRFFVHTTLWRHSIHQISPYRI